MTKLNKNQQAPAFEMKDLYGKSIKLGNYKGKKVLLAIFRYASCPFCNLRVHELIKNYEKLKNEGLEIIAVFKSTEAEIKKYVNTQKPPFTIIPDEKGVLYQKYGIEKSFAGFLKSMLRVSELVYTMRKGFFSLKTLPEPQLIPGDFLINEKGMIEEAYYGKDFGDHLPLEKIKKWLEKEVVGVG